MLRGKYDLLVMAALVIASLIAGGLFDPFNTRRARTIQTESAVASTTEQPNSTPPRVDIYHLVVAYANGYTPMSPHIRQSGDIDRYGASHSACNFRHINDVNRSVMRQIECDLWVTHGQPANFTVDADPTHTDDRLPHASTFACEQDDENGILALNPAFRVTATRNGSPVALIPSSSGGVGCELHVIDTPCPSFANRQADGSCRPRPRNSN